MTYINFLLVCSKRNWKHHLEMCSFLIVVVVVVVVVGEFATAANMAPPLAHATTHNDWPNEWRSF